LRYPSQIGKVYAIDSCAIDDIIAKFQNDISKYITNVTGTVFPTFNILRVPSNKCHSRNRFSGSSASDSFLGESPIPSDSQKRQSKSTTFSSTEAQSQHHTKTFAEILPGLPLQITLPKSRW
ncbi:hypothetical protein T09_6187, partial [Trichinella sp. T9]